MARPDLSAGIKAASLLTVRRDKRQPHFLSWKRNTFSSEKDASCTHDYTLVALSQHNLLAFQLTWTDSWVYASACAYTIHGLGSLVCALAVRLLELQIGYLVLRIEDNYHPRRCPTRGSASAAHSYAVFLLASDSRMQASLGAFRRLLGRELFSLLEH